jgi:hypothetical protein
VIASQPTAAGNPTKAPLDDPPPGLNRKALLAFLGFDDLDRYDRGRAKTLASMGAVGKSSGRGTGSAHARHDAG